MHIQELPEVAFIFADTSEQMRKAKMTELEVFRESGYVAYDSGSEVKEYVPYDSCSDFFVAIAPGKSDEIVGVLRRIRASEVGLPTLNDFEVEAYWRDLVAQELTLKHAAEIASVAVRKPFRAKGGFAVFSGLLRAVWQDSLLRGIRWWTFSIDTRAARFVRTVYHFDMKPVAVSKFYMGSPTIPMALDIQQEALTIWDKAPDVAEYLFRGLDPARLASIMANARKGELAGQ